jgi:hypothetical protein
MELATPRFATIARPRKMVTWAAQLFLGTGGEETIGMAPDQWPMQ